MPDSGPSPEEVKAELEKVWADVRELNKTRGGRKLMQAAAEAYEGHDE